MNRDIENMFREYDRKMNEMYNDSPIYEYDDLFGVYRAHRKVLLMMRGEASDEEKESAIKAFCAEVDALRIRKDAPERIYLWPQDNMPEKEHTEMPDAFQMPTGFRPYMYALPFDQKVTPKGAILFVAGGAQGRSVINEGYGIALDFQEMGYQCFVIHNRVNAIDMQNKASFNGEENGADIARAIRYIRAHAKEYRIDENNVAAAGFSNGGVTIENCVRYYSGSKGVQDYFESYRPDTLDEFNGCPDAYLNIYGPRFIEAPFDWTDVHYPPVFFACGREDETGALNNLYALIPDLVEHNVPMEIHTFASTPHGRAAYHRIWQKEDHANFDLFVPLADAFIQDVFKKKGDLVK